MSFNQDKMDILTVLVFAMLAGCVNSVVDFTDFHITPGYRVTSQKIVLSQAKSVVKCAILCMASTECRMASYIASLEQCFLSASWYTDPMDFQIVEEPGTLLLRKSDPTTFYADREHWILAFRAHAHSGIHLWTSWTNTNHHDDLPSIYFNLPLGCVTVRSDLTCDRFYRSQLLDHWTNIEQVQIAFFTAGVKVSYVTFNASRSVDKNDFMHPNTILDTSITELQGGYNGTYNYFNVTGENITVDRRFYLSHSFAGCPYDLTWFVVVSGSPVVCVWETAHSYPSFLYTKSGWKTAFASTEPGRAEVFAVFIKRSA